MLSSTAFDCRSTPNSAILRQVCTCGALLKAPYRVHKDSQCITTVSRQVLHSELLLKKKLVEMSTLQHTASRHAWTLQASMKEVITVLHAVQ